MLDQRGHERVGFGADDARVRHKDPFTLRSAWFRGCRKLGSLHLMRVAVDNECSNATRRLAHAIPALIRFHQAPECATRAKPAILKYPRGGGLPCVGADGSTLRSLQYPLASRPFGRTGPWPPMSLTCYRQALPVATTRAACPNRHTACNSTPGPRSSIPAG